MKKKLIALFCAAVMVLSLASCALSTPDTVGQIGDVEITSGLYLLAQFNAYQSAADLADSDADTSDVKAFLKQTITVDSDTEETALVSDYVAQKTLENLELYAAIESRFDQLGGELTAEEESQADSYASQLMEQYSSTYEANGIGLETLKRFERILLKSSDLLDLVYGENGETPLSDDELTNHVENEMYELVYYTIPLYNTSTYAFADDDQKATMLELAQSAATAASGVAEDATSQVNAFVRSASAVLDSIYTVLDSTPSDSDTSPLNELLSSDTIDSAFTTEGSADTIRSLSFGQATAVQYSSLSMMMALRVDPLEVSTLDDLRTRIISDMKSTELQDSLAAYGAEMEHQLSSSAMSKMPASKIVNS